jgi:streptomycin 3"-adenylyltransferase
VSQLDDIVVLVRSVLDDTALAGYLHGSAVLGGLRPTSDLDVLVMTHRPSSEPERRALVDELLGISGRRARRGPGRPVELTLVVQSEVRPWRYPPTADFQYGEWLRDDYEAGRLPERTSSPDLAVLLTLVRAKGEPLFGPPPTDLFDAVPPDDLRHAMLDGIPALLGDLETDTRNVLLTLARIVGTLETGDIRPKDDAAARLLDRLPELERTVLDRARAGYLAGDRDDDWADAMPSAQALAERLTRDARSLSGPSHDASR